MYALALKGKTSPKLLTVLLPSFTLNKSSHTSSRLHNQNVTLTSPSFKDPRIGVKVHAYAWKAHSSHVPESRLAQPKRDQDFSKPKSATHMRRSP
ncbi:hypothetical protein PIB30_099705, partial [Stylosanthes scabra]|nr:hypothetical protein [Stylosanthes scabra]